VSPLALGALGSLLAGMMTGVGALPVLLRRDVPVRAQDALLGFAAGVMLAASFFSLLLPSLEAARGLYGEGMAPGLIAVAGVLVGAGAIALANETVPHQHFVLGRQGPVSDSLRRIWLFVLAITLHNFPEGLAVGVGFGGGDVAGGTSLAIGIGLQNAPEGLAVAVALGTEGYSRRTAFAIAAATGLVEPLGGLIGAAAVSVSEVALPWALAFAAGAMIYVISHEIIPETHRRGHENLATAGLVAGLVAMMFLDVSFG
jgi:zinc transporter, ZIP family